jgi:transposase
MQHIQGLERNQVTLFPDVLDDYVAQDNPVRFLDAFVDGLDLLALGFDHAILKQTGRPPYHPADLLKLYVYGYLNRLRSSRLLEREAGRNLELMWLLKRLTPDFKTVADFRRDNRQAIRQVCRQFTLFCRQLDLFGGELVAIDGSKFKAHNAKGRNFTHKKLKRHIKDLEKKIDEYLEELDQADEEEKDLPDKPNADQLREKIEAMKRRQAELREIEQQMKDSGQSQISLTDPDSRAMPVGGGEATLVAYNVQLSVDAKHKLIVDHEVTNDVTDLGLLSQMAKRAKEALGADEIDALADMGYYDGQEVKACLEEGITPYIPKANTSANRRRGLFTKQHFRYDPQEDCYWCPADQPLTFRFQTTEQGRQIRYYANPGACRQCPLKGRCTRNKNGRRITRWIDEHLLEAMQARVEAEPHKVALRKQLVEHPFGTIKHSMNQGYFLMRGLEKVRAETALTVMAYNIKRVIRILGVPRMIQALS